MFPHTAVIRRSLTRHAIRYNRPQRCLGNLFPNRYKSILYQEDSYLLEFVRQIHLNPLRGYQQFAAHSLLCWGLLASQA
jgi:hypothetical protein